MAFTSWKFLLFFAVVSLLYYVLPKKFRWIVLLVGSYVFYAFASPVYLAFLLGSTLITFFGALLIHRYRERPKPAKALLVVTIILQIGMLAIFKYADFFGQTVVGIVNMFGASGSWSAWNLILPLGLSFYVFQSLGYTIDVFWGKTEPTRNVFHYALFVSFFPSLLQGPISDYGQLSGQLIEGHDFDMDNISYGIKRCLWGFFKKLVIADQIAQITNGIWSNYSSYHGLIWVLVIILYLIQIYADFSGYMDIAVGCSKMLGINLTENFNRPYFSKTVPEYWRRWHISLGAWFRTYVFYPILKGRACSSIRRGLRKKHKVLSTTIPDAIALLIVWVLLGFWHGPSWGYVAYGVYYGILISASVLIGPTVKRFHSRFPSCKDNRFFVLFQIARTLFLVAIGSFLFRPADFMASMTILKNIVSNPGLMEIAQFGFDNMLALLIILIGTVVLFVVDLYAVRHQGESIIVGIGRLKIGWRYVLYIALFAAVLFLGAYWSASTNQFMYFKF